MGGLAGKLLNAVGGDMAKDIMGAIGDLFTSDEERLQKQNELQSIINNHAEKMADIEARFEEQLTARHAADMASDSWLSKNIRPLTLAFLTVATVLLAYLTIFGLNPDKIVLLNPWINILQTLLMTAFVFYFGGRSLEKIKRLPTAAPQAPPAQTKATTPKPVKKPADDVWGEDDNISG